MIFAFLSLTAQNAEINKLKNDLYHHTQNNSEKVDLLTDLASKYFTIDNDTAFYYINNALKLSESINYKKGIAKSHILFGTYNYYKFDYPKALEFYKKSLNLYEEIEDDKGKSKSLHNIGFIYWKQNNQEKSLEYYNKSLLLFEVLGDNPSIADCLNNIGLIYWNLGEYDKALDYYDHSLAIFEELNNKRGIAQCLFNIGQIYRSRGNYPVALDYCNKSLIIVEELGDKRRIAQRLNFIGLIYSYQEDYTLAIDNYSKSLKLNEELQDREGIASCLNNLGSIYKDKGENDAAIENYIEALNIFEEIKFKIGVADALSNIGLIHRNKENYDLALEYLFKALNVREEIGDYEGLSYSNGVIGEVYFLKNELDQALNYTQKSLKTALKLGLLLKQKESHHLLSTIYATLKTYDKAYENHLLYKELNDRIFNEDNIKKLAELEYQYEFEKAKQLIALEQQKKDAITAEKSKRQRVLSTVFILGFILMTVLVVLIYRSSIQKRKANFKLAKQKKQIEDANEVLTVQKKELQDFANELEIANKTKDKFFSIIAHDLRGPLGNLMGFGELLMTRGNKIEEKTKKKYIELIATDAKNTFNLLDNLLKWALSNTEGIIPNFERLNVNEIVKENISFFKTMAEAKELTLIDSLNEKIVVTADYDMINTVLRNLISNAIKFTPNNGIIEILSRKTSDNRIEIGISDTGVGIEAETLSKLFDTDSHITTSGTNNERGSGLGLKLCKEFVEKNEGTIYVESKLGNGTTFWISLPSTAHN